MVDALRNSVEAKFGRKITYHKDCKSLSDIIFGITKELISDSTLRRFFGLLATNSNPSRVTLDILSRYVGFHDWQAYCNSLHGQRVVSTSIDEQWAALARSAKAISQNTVKRIKQKSGINFNATVNRLFVEERLRNFIKSDHGATAIVAPGGYGKSTLLAKWYLSMTGSNHASDDILLFIPAITLAQHITSELYVESWFQRFIGLNASDNFIARHFTDSTAPPPGKLIVIIDAIDEITMQGARQNKIFSFIAEIIDRYTGNGHLKIIVSTRSYNWDILLSTIPDISKWYFVRNEHFSSQRANIPPFTYEETQQILDSSVNTRFPNRLLVYELHPDMLEAISYPYFMQLFVQIYTPNNIQFLIDQIGVLNEFLKQQVHLSQYADEKNDILNFIIVKTDYGRSHLSKNSLKANYPIHLKHHGNYQIAYEELVSFGILNEDVVIDPIDGYQRNVTVSNQHILCVLAVQNIIREQGGISASLFLWIQNQLSGHEHLPQIIEILFKYAFKEQYASALKEFFTLNVDVLEQTIHLNGITPTLRTNPTLQRLLVPSYMKQRIARRLLVEESIDINHIATSYSYLLTLYLKNVHTPHEIMFGRTFLLFGGFITMNAPLVQANFVSTEQPIIREYSPTLVATWYSNRIMYAAYIAGTSTAKLLEEAYTYYTSLKDFDKKTDFMEIFSVVLNVLELHNSLLKFIETGLLNTPDTSPHRAAVAFIIKQCALHANGKIVSPEATQTISMHYTNLSPQSGLTTIIQGEMMRTSYYIGANNLESAYSCIRNALELSTGSGMKLVEAMLVKKLSWYMMQMLELEKASKLDAYNQQLWKISGFKKYPPQNYNSTCC